MSRSVGPALTVVGSGYVGTVVAACFAALGRRVVGVEAEPRRLRLLERGRVPFFEARLDDLVASGTRSGRLTFTADVHQAVASTDVIFLCVGTPESPDGDANLHALEAAGRSIGRALDSEGVLVTKSTVPVGTGQWLASVVEHELPRKLRNTRAVSVVSNPEFLRQGSAVNDFLHPDRVVLGSDDSDALDTMSEVYRPILDQDFLGANGHPPPQLVRTSLATAEAIKYASNAFLATKVSFINEIANICELVGADVTEVAAAVGLDSRIGSRFLEAGAGWGGSCFGKDLAALVRAAKHHGYQPRLLQAVVGVNQRQRRFVVEKVRRHLKTLRGRQVGLLGLSFKPGTDDLRDSPALDVAKRLLTHGATVVAYDPVVHAVPVVRSLRLVRDPYDVADDADAIVLATDWPQFRDLDPRRLLSRMRGRVFVDARNQLDPRRMREAGFLYEAIGRGANHGGVHSE